MDLFEVQKAKTLALQQEINQTDKEIDRMVYALCGLTEKLRLWKENWINECHIKAD